MLRKLLLSLASRSKGSVNGTVMKKNMENMKFIRNYFKIKNFKTSIFARKKFTIKDESKRTKSIKLTIFLMRALGLWHPSGKLEKILSNILMCGTLIMMVYDIISQFKDLYNFRNDIMNFTYAAPLAALVATELLKTIIFIWNREKVMQINRFINENFWMKEYDAEETRIFNYYDKICTNAIVVFVVLGQCVSWHYLLLPAFEENTNETRRLPFTMPIHLSLWAKTPVYEIVYFTMILGTMSLFLCTITFASYLFSISLFTAAQFKILGKNFEKLCDFESSSNGESRIQRQMKIVGMLKQCIKRHQMLISFTKEIENLYCYILLGQMFGSVMEICFCGLQILLDPTVPQRNILSFNLLLSLSLQLYLFCFSSHEVFLASENIANAVYSMNWRRITDPQIHKHFALSVQIIVHRARRPCILSVGKFYPLTLETFASVLSTSLSYFMVLRKIINVTGSDENKTIFN